VTLAEQYRFATDQSDVDDVAPNAVMFDVSDRVLIEVTGRDRVTFLHSFCTNDIKKLQPEEGCEAFVTNVKGRILGHVLVFATVSQDGPLWIHSDPGTAPALLEHFNRYVITEDVQFIDRTAEYEKVFACGKDAASRIQVTPIAMEITGEEKMYSLTPSLDFVQRVPFAIPCGYLAMLSIAAIDDKKFVWDCLESSGGVEGGGIIPGSREVLEVLRIEALWPRYGVDITEDHLAQEAGRTSQAISFTKGCYLGQEPIARLDALGHTNRELRGIRCDAPGAVTAGAVVLDSAGGAEVGRISSAAVHPVTNCAVALAMVKTVANAPGTTVRVRTEDGHEIGGVVFGPPETA
jgi:tRNA-modifying protein YgfZ